MRHAREDYERIQDPAGTIPEDEPVFLLRAQDATAPGVVDFWAQQAALAGAAPEMVQLARQHADRMLDWQFKNGRKTPDLPESQR